jgi:peptide/nickel transport system ATP-binding protein
VLKVRDLKISFQTEGGLVPAVDGISFDVAEAEILGVVGESGSGKTLSLMAVMGLINDPNVVIEGSVRFRGQELIGLAPRELRTLRGRDIAMIFQDPMTALTPVYTIGWHIAEQIMAHEKIGRRAALARAADLLAEVNIPNPHQALERYPHQLSGGMRQRAVIAMALSCNPALLIADEPTTALDVTVQAQILDLVRKLRRDHGSAIVFITHDMGVIAEIADRVMVMYAGRIVEKGSKPEVLAHPRHPYTRALIDSIPPLTGERPRRLRSIPGSPPSPLALPKGCAFGPRCPSCFDKCVERPPLKGSAHQSACFLETPS